MTKYTSGVSTTYWKNFYTPDEVAEKIISLIPSSYSPEQIVDICVGSGNFIKAATARWKNAMSIGIDVLPDVSAKNICDFIYETDALYHENLDKINFSNNKLVVANPPFGKANVLPVCVDEKHKELQTLAIKSKRMEALMIASNLYLLKEGEIFAAVLPDNIFNAEKFKEFKDIFLSYFEILFLGEAFKYFVGSEVKTRIFIGKYKQKKISDFKHVNKSLINNKPSIEIWRGIDNSKLTTDKIKNLIPVLHFCNKDAKVFLDRYVDAGIYNNNRRLKNNDLLISRVGRSSGKVIIVRPEFIGKFVSDYFYVIKGGAKLLKMEQVKDLEKKLQSCRRGLTAKYITKSDITFNFESLID